jgi:hypothetical protein
MVSAEFYRQVQLERDALQSQVFRLREFIKAHPYREPSAPGQAEAATAKLLREEPEQSLAHIQAATLRAAEAEFLKIDCPHAAGKLRSMAQTLAPGAGL